MEYGTKRGVVGVPLTCESSGTTTTQLQRRQYLVVLLTNLHVKINVLSYAIQVLLDDKALIGK